MSLVRWKPSYDLPFSSGLLDVQREINRMFDNFFREGSQEGDSLATTAWMPPVDIEELDHQFTVQVELPGVVKDDVKIVMQDNILTIRGEKKYEHEENERGQHRIERSYGAFERSIMLPAEIDEAQAKAEYKNGVLRLTLPKRPDSQSQRKTIPVT